MVPTASQSQPSAHILIYAAEGILAFNIGLVLYTYIYYVYTFPLASVFCVSATTKIKHYYCEACEVDCETVEVRYFHILLNL